MGRFFLIVVFMFLRTACFSQSNEAWKTYIDHNSTQTHPNTKYDFYLIESPRAKLFEKGLSIVKSVDASHHVVKGEVDPNQFSNVWRVNDEWKLDLERNPVKSDRFWVVVTDSSEVQIHKPFKVLKSYPEYNTYLVQADLALIKDHLLPRWDILHISDKEVAPHVESRVIDLNLNPNRINKIHYFYSELNGSSETISVQENKFDENDIDLLNRTVFSGLESDITDNHATEMATIIGGKGNSFITGRGVAGEVTLTSSDFSDAMPDPLADYEDMGILTQNHSYGIVMESEYGVQARAFDQSTFLNPNLLHVFSSGNEGNTISGEGRYQGIAGYANLTGNIKMTKNSLVVGSVDTVGQVPSFVSRGPAYDGRIKPDVVAYSVVGSSNSAALVSGVSVLLQQQYRVDQAGEDMPAALVKALLINGAEDVGEEGPDFITGYGSIDAWKSLQALKNKQYFEGVVGNGEAETFTIILPSDATNLKVTLVWTDPPANVGDFQALVNDLDLMLSDGSNTLYPWVLDATPSVSSLSKPATRGEDHLNNVEQVTIENPTENYTITVKGTRVSGSQKFYIAWQFEPANSFEWDFPMPIDNIPYNGETGSYFRWSTTLEGLGALSYTTDGVNWITLDPTVNLAGERWRWNNPPILNDVVKARMTIGGIHFETEYFSLSEPVEKSVGFNCADSVMLRWEQVPAASDYTVMLLGEESLEVYATVSDTFLVVGGKHLLPSTFFSIRPNLPEGKSLIPTPSFDYTLQGIECFLFSFFQTVALDTGIYLNMKLGTSYGIDQIIFERNDFRSGFKEIARVLNPTVEEIQILDSSPNQGYNEHRATIYFQNGETLVFSAGSSFYLTEEPIRIFPNPALVGEELVVITKEFEDTSPIIELIDDNGALIYRKEIFGTQDVIPTDRLGVGIYFYRLFADGKYHTGRILLR